MALEFGFGNLCLPDPALFWPTSCAPRLQDACKPDSILWEIFRRRIWVQVRVSSYICYFTSAADLWQINDSSSRHRPSSCHNWGARTVAFFAIALVWRRHVVLPSDIAALLPKKRLLAEVSFFRCCECSLILIWIISRHLRSLKNEWRGIGVQQSRGWVHYAIHNPEPHIMLFRYVYDQCAASWWAQKEHGWLWAILWQTAQELPAEPRSTDTGSAGQWHGASTVIQTCTENSSQHCQQPGPLCRQKLNECSQNLMVPAYLQTGFSLRCWCGSCWLLCLTQWMICWGYHLAWMGMHAMQVSYHQNELRMDLLLSFRWQNWCSKSASSVMHR